MSWGNHPQISVEIKFVTQCSLLRGFLIITYRWGNICKCNNNWSIWSHGSLLKFIFQKLFLLTALFPLVVLQWHSPQHKSSRLWLHDMPHSFEQQFWINSNLIVTVTYQYVPRAWLVLYIYWICLSRNQSECSPISYMNPHVVYRKSNVFSKPW